MRLPRSIRFVGLTVAAVFAGWAAFPFIGWLGILFPVAWGASLYFGMRTGTENAPKLHWNRHRSSVRSFLGLFLLLAIIFGPAALIAASGRWYTAFAWAVLIFFGLIAAARAERLIRESFTRVSSSR